MLHLVPLRQLSLLTGTDVSALPRPELLARIRQLFGFLGELGEIELRDIYELQTPKSEWRTSASGSKPNLPPSKLDDRTLHELSGLLDEANQLVAITVASRKTARGSE